MTEGRKDRQTAGTKERGMDCRNQGIKGGTGSHKDRRRDAEGAPQGHWPRRQAGACGDGLPDPGLTRAGLARACHIPRRIHRFLRISVPITISDYLRISVHLLSLAISVSPLLRGTHRQSVGCTLRVSRFNTRVWPADCAAG